MNSIPDPQLPFPSQIPDSVQFQNPNPKPNPNLSDALSSLSSLVALSEHTLTALSNAFPDLVDPRNVGLDDESFISCPLDARHVVPPEGLFRHHLNCHTPLGTNLEMIRLPNYCNALGSLGEVDRRKDGFVGRVSDGDAQFHFGIDEYLGDSGGNFFYEACPGVVGGIFGSDGDGAGSGRMFTLPAVLFDECADFFAASDDVMHGETIEDDWRSCERGVLPSGYWRVSMELEGWVDYPTSYSRNMLHTILSLGKLDVGIFRRCLIGMSPQYGVIVDGAMADHMLVLFRLCMKTIMREGVSLANDLAAKGNTGSEEFACPHLVIVIAWLASQFSILYGDVNGKLFSIDLFKRCIGEIAASIVMYKHVDIIGKPSNDIACSQQTKSDGNNGEGGDEGSEMKEIDSDVAVVESFCSKLIYTSQVVAAVAALHKRSLLEGKIKTSLHSVPLSSYQRMLEHAFITNRAKEERKKRPDYKPIIDHDGLPRQSASAQEVNKKKTVEELMAEERDYKRRRMSYRGKKSNRNPSEVMRGIIEGYMEEINQAGGIGCFDKNADIIPVNSSFNISSERERLADYRMKPSIDEHEVLSSFSFHDRNGPKNRKSIQVVEHFDDEVERCDEAKRDRKYHPYSPERSHRKHSYEHQSHLSEGGGGVGLKSERKRSSSGGSKYEDAYPSRRGKDDSYRKSEYKDRRLRSTHGKPSSNFLARNGFEDRYDPSRSDDSVH